MRWERCTAQNEGIALTDQNFYDNFYEHNLVFNGQLSLLTDTVIRYLRVEYLAYISAGLFVTSCQLYVPPIRNSVFNHFINLGAVSFSFSSSSSSLFFILTFPGSFLKFPVPFWALNKTFQSKLHVLSQQKSTSIFPLIV